MFILVGIHYSPCPSVVFFHSLGERRNPQTQDPHQIVPQNRSLCAPMFRQNRPLFPSTSPHMSWFAQSNGPNNSTSAKVPLIQARCFSQAPGCRGSCHVSRWYRKTGRFHWTQSKGWQAAESVQGRRRDFLTLCLVRRINPERNTNEQKETKEHPVLHTQT